MKRKGKKAKLNNSQRRRRRRRRDGRVGRAAGQSQGLKRERERETYLVPCLPLSFLTPSGSLFYAIRVLRAFRSTWLLL